MGLGDEGLEGRRWEGVEEEEEAEGGEKDALDPTR